MELCIALDLPSREENLKLAESIKNFDVWLKVGLRSFIRDGKAFLDDLKKINPHFKIFLDLKLYDIPNTMADASEEIARMGVDMFNIHASSGATAMGEVMKRLGKFKKRPLVLAVTALTSFDNEEFKKIYYANIDTKAKDFAKEAHRLGLDGVVCSAFESKGIKDETDLGFLTLAPGIRPFGEASDDQKRVANIDIAKSSLVDFIVVGRPIYKAQNPAQVVEKVLASL